MANKEKRFETIYTQGTSLSIVVDTETGVNYLVHDTGITPLLDKNGTVVITEIIQPKNSMPSFFTMTSNIFFA